MFGPQVNQTSSISGPGYWAPMPPGFTVAAGNPAMGVYRLFPPGASAYDIQALVQIRPVMAFELPMLLANLNGFDNPTVAFMNAANLGLVRVLAVVPVRQMQMPQGITHIREFDAVALTGLPVRVMVLVMQNIAAAVEVVVMMGLYRWTEFVAPCLDFVARINLGGVAAPVPQLQAVFDENRKEQIEYRLVSPNHEPIPLTALPTNVGGVTIIHIDTLIHTGDINGTGIAIGAHSVATVTSGKGPGQA